MPNNFLEQEKTLKDAEDKLKEFSKCVIIRPTGFGKTFILTELIHKYNNVLYLYPSAVIKNTVVNRYCDLITDNETEDDSVVDPETIETYRELKEIPNCDLMTYQKLIRLSNKELQDMKYDLILFDEVHRVGGKRTKVAVEKLFAYHGDHSKFIGATATPTRMDNFDVVSHFFNDIMCYTYTLFDAIQDGLIQKPNYCYLTHDYAEDLKTEAINAGENIDDEDVKKVIDAKIIELANLFGVPKIIKSVCKTYAKDTDYMKFIAFFASSQHMDDTIDQVIDWFKKAYPKHNINVLKISSRNNGESKNVDVLESLNARKKTIDIIACIDMLNVGYHVDNLTGIIMYRGTKSNTIFVQQLGRALSVGANNSAIVFDIVDNLHKKAIYELRSSLSNKILRNRKGVQPENMRSYIEEMSKTELKQRISKELKLDKDNKSIVIVDNGEVIKTQYHLDDHLNIVDKNNNPSSYIYDAKNNRIINIGTSTDDPCKNINTITKECLNSTGHEASYREIIAKSMVEPLTQRCKYALELHFRSWCNSKGVPYPISNDKLKTLYGLSKEDFYKEFCNIVSKNKIAYPLQDAEAILKIGANANSNEIPLKICAKARNVSVEQILDLLFNAQKV